MQYKLRSTYWISTMFNDQPSPIMIVHGETAKKMIEHVKSPERSYSKEVNIARERLRKAGIFKLSVA